MAVKGARKLHPKVQGDVEGKTYESEKKELKISEKNKGVPEYKENNRTMTRKITCLDLHQWQLWEGSLKRVFEPFVKQTAEHHSSFMSNCYHADKMLTG